MPWEGFGLWSSRHQASYGDIIAFDFWWRCTKFLNLKIISQEGDQNDDTKSLENDDTKSLGDTIYIYTWFMYYNMIYLFTYMYVLYFKFYIHNIIIFDIKHLPQSSCRLPCVAPLLHDTSPTNTLGLAHQLLDEEIWSSEPQAVKPLGQHPKGWSVWHREVETQTRWSQLIGSSLCGFSWSKKICWEQKRNETIWDFCLHSEYIFVFQH